MKISPDGKLLHVLEIAAGDGTTNAAFGEGEKERAIDELERPYQTGDTNYLFVVKVDPLLDDLRGDPRFEALVQKVIASKTLQ